VARTSICIAFQLSSKASLYYSRNGSWRELTPNGNYGKKERERESEKSSSITYLTLYSIYGKGSIYTWRGKPTSLGSMPSVHHQARDEIPRLGCTT
jgi:hypothetical protein